jgi:hypothetical protein
MVPVSASHGDPDKHLAFPMDRDVVWDTPDGERVSDAGDSRIQEYTPHISGRQGMLFAPQSITDYRNTPERKRYVNDIANWGRDYQSSQVYPPPVDDYEEDELPEDRSRFREGIRHAISTSRMPTELIPHLPIVEMIYDDLEFPQGEDDYTGLYKHDYRYGEHQIHINPNRGSLKDNNSSFQKLLLHELGHSVDYHINGHIVDYLTNKSTRNYDKSNITVTDHNNPDPRMEGAAVGFADRYGINSEEQHSKTPEDPTIEDGYHSYSNARLQLGPYGDKGWGHPRGTDIFTAMRRHTRDTGEMPEVGSIDFLSDPKHSHMSEQFHQPTLWDN